MSKTQNNNTNENKRKMKKRRKWGFTLVELIVVITILAILGTIAFISFQNYTKDSRDGGRIADINSIQKNLGLFVIEKGYYPNPDGGTGITYKGSLAWTQGTIGDGVFTNLGKLSKKPIDLLTNNEYTYSITNNRLEYQIGAMQETSLVGYSIPAIDSTHAAGDKIGTAMIKGSYNEKMLKIDTGSMFYILALPTIISADISETDLQAQIDNKLLVYDDYGNLPHSYNDLGYTMTGGFDFNAPNIEIFSGTTGDLDGNDGKIELITNLRNFYSNSMLKGEDAYKDIVNIDPNNKPVVVALANDYLLKNIGGVSGENSTFTYANCSSSGTYILNGHTFNIPETKHSEYALNTLSSNVAENNGNFKYELTSIECNDGNLINATENPTPIVENCDPGYTQSGNNCIPNNNTVTFDGNGSTGGSTATQIILTGNSANLTANGFIKTGYTFAGWSTTPGGDVEYVNGANYTMGPSGVTLYAKWTINTYTITFNGYGNTGGSTANQEIVSGTSENLTANGFVKTGYTFAGWSTTAGGAQAYANGANYTMGTSNVTLYARWTANTYLITLNANGGTLGTASVNATYGLAMPTLATASTWAGYIFNGYFNATTGGTKYYNADRSSASVWNIASNTTLYAQWNYTYSRLIGSWGGCNVSCGGGTQTRSVVCRRNDGVTVADAYCTSKPAVSQSCNTQSCWTCSKGSWLASDRGATIDYDTITEGYTQAGCESWCMGILNGAQKGNTGQHICVRRPTGRCHLYLDDSPQGALESGRTYQIINCHN